MDANQLISIIMPCYNAQKTLPETLNSIPRQSYSNWELIAIDDGSKDKTLKLLNDFRDRYPKQVKIISHPNQGQVKSKNRGLEIAQGSFIAFMDADDLWHPQKLNSQLTYMLEHAEIGLCYTNGEYIDEASNHTGPIGINPRLSGQCLHEFLMGNAIVASSVMIKKEIISQVGYFDESLTACENWELWTRISSISEIGVIDESLVYYRRHSHNMSHNIEKMKRNRILVIQKNRHQYKSLFTDMGKRTKLALYRAYEFFGENALWHLDIDEARRNLFKALRYQPRAWRCWILLLKSFLGRSILIRIRKYKAIYG
ncbi:MAG: glycosyltransferase [Gammaproteobacteria bacterium]